jgi:hypothetical protein
MIEKVNNNQIQDLFDGKARQAAQPKAADTQAASVQIDYAALIEKATQPRTDDPEAVQRARELISSGRIDDPNRIRQAAQNIINYGI